MDHTMHQDHAQSALQHAGHGIAKAGASHSKAPGAAVVAGTVADGGSL